MKGKNKNKIVAAALLLLVAGPFSAVAQDSTKKELVVNLGYFTNDNKITWLMVNTKTKIDKKFKPVKDVTINLYLDKDSVANLVGKVTTNEKGVAKAIIPPALKALWQESPTHTFIAVSEANKEFEETKTEATVTKTKITIDTLSDGETKTIAVKVSSFNGTEWLPAPGVEMKVGISRAAGSILSAGDEATYTTDSSGTVAAEFKKTKLPGDEKGNIVLIAKVEDNDKYGNLVVEKSVPWGVVVKSDNGFFDQRTLWSTRFKTPLWLLFMAYSIVIGVWGTIIYLVVQLVKIKKLASSPT